MTDGSRSTVDLLGSTVLPIMWEFILLQIFLNLRIDDELVTLQMTGRSEMGV